MRRTLVPAVLLVLGLALLIRSRVSVNTEGPRVARAAQIELAPLCPWREPQRDLQELFPGATNYVTETRILSGLRPQLQQRLGRVPGAEENALLIHRVTSSSGQLGSVLVRRVKGEHGGIEIVTAVDRQGAVNGVLIQSQREPAVIAQAITSKQWLAGFVAKDVNSPMRLGHDLQDLVPEARTSAQAIADGIRSQLVLLSFAEQGLRSPNSGHSDAGKH